MSSASKVKLLYIKEEVFGETPASPDMKSIPFNTGDAFSNSRDALTSAQVQSTRKPRKTRLGTNNPSKTHSFELQYLMFDDLLSGGFGEPWIGGIDVTDTVTVASSTITLDSGSWDDYNGVEEGAFLLFDDDGTLIVLEVDSISGTSNEILNVLDLGGADPTLTVASASEKTMIFGFVGVGLSCDETDDVTFSAINKTVTLAAGFDTWATLEFKVGDNVWFDSTSNEGWFKIDSLDGREATLTTAPVDETVDTGTLSIFTDAGVISNGNEIPSFTFEEQFLDHNDDEGAFRPIRGTRIDQVAFSVETSSMIGVTLNLEGAEIEDFAESSIANSETDYTNRDAFDSFTGSLWMDGSEIPLSGFDLTINNQNNRNFALFERNAYDMTVGVPEMSGTVNAFFNDTVNASKFFDETEFQIQIRMEDPDGNSYTLSIDSAKYTGNTISIGDIDVTESLPFNVEPVDSGSEIEFRRQVKERS
jgi:hypothetical protein